MLTAGVSAAIQGFIWPKIFFDFLTHNFDRLVKPFPFLQMFNLLLGIFVLLLEWPVGVIAGTSIHRSIEARLIFLPLTIIASALLYQATNPAIYYTVGLCVYFWAYSEGETVAAKPWSLPPRPQSNKV
ncbi:hypothetical protein K3495_g12236 [Podosphaera aphanis]|nr:hypothetical protein K3495_g12236 [Podosphaera aphanis]